MNGEQKAVGALYSARVLIEGVEVPFSSLEAQFSVGSPGSATLVVPYVRTMYGLKPRSAVYVYVKEVVGGQSVNARGEVYTPREEGLAAEDLSDYRLMYVFELVGYSVQTGVGGVFASWSCVGLWSYLDSAKVYWGSKKAAHQGARTAAFVGATTIGIKRTGSSRSDIVSLIRSRPKTNPKAKGILASCTSLIEGAVGLQKKYYARSYRGMNDYLTFAEARFRLTRMVFAHPDDNSSELMVDSKSFARYFRNVSRSVRSTASVGQLINVLLSKVYHYVVPVPFSPFTPPGTTTYTEERVRVGTTTFPELEKIHSLVYRTYMVIQQRFRDTDAEKIAIARETAAGNPRDEAYAAEVDRISSRPALQSAPAEKLVPDTSMHEKVNAQIKDIGLVAYYERGGTGGASLRGELNAIIAKQYGRRTSTPKARAMSAALAQLALAVNLIKALERKSGDVYPAHNTPVYARLSDALERVLKAFGNSSKGVYRKEKVPVELGDRLNAYFMAPDLYMAPPPTCNVLFPSDVSGFSFGRAWMAETTRLWLHSRTRTGRNKKDIYFSPDLTWGAKFSSDATNVDVNATEAVKKGHTFVMPHERFTGIIPKLEGLGDTDIYKKMHQRKVRSRKRQAAEGAAGAEARAGQDAARSGSLSVGRGESSPNPHMQHSANYMFFADRYGQRSATVQARFLPEIVPGLPAVVFDPALVSGDRPRENKHLLGLVHTVIHRIRASGDFRTTVALTKCRMHDEDQDLFYDDGTATRRRTASTKRKLRPPNGGEFIYPANEDVLSSPGKAVIPSRLSKLSKVYVANLGAGSDTVDAETYTLPRDVGSLRMQIKKYPDRYWRESAEEQYSEDLSKDGHRLVRYRYESATLKQSISMTGVVVELYRVGSSKSESEFEYDLDDTLYPPWISDIYKKDRIGPEFYQTLLGCGSIMDNVSAVFDQDVRVDDFPAGPGLPDGPPTTIKEAVELLAHTWSVAHQADGDVGKFTQAYRARRYADMFDIHGAAAFDATAKQLRFTRNVAIPDSKKVRAYGIHAEAISGRAEKWASVEFPGTSIAERVADTRVGGRAPSVSELVDVRKERWEAARAYHDDITSRAQSSDTNTAEIQDDE